MPTLEVTGNRSHEIHKILRRLDLAGPHARCTNWDGKTTVHKWDSTKPLSCVRQAVQEEFGNSLVQINP